MSNDTYWAPVTKGGHILVEHISRYEDLAWANFAMKYPGADAFDKTVVLLKRSGLTVRRVRVVLVKEESP